MSLLQTTRTISATGPADPGLVWRRYAEPRLWPTWAPHLTSVEASTDTIEAGTEGTVTALGVVPARFVVDEVDAGDRTWSWTVRLGHIRLQLAHAVMPGRDGHGTTTTLSVHGPRALVVGYLPVAGWALRRLVSE